MEYNHIIAAVPEGENFDASAVNEGVWLSMGHLNSIENKLAENETAFNGIKEQLSTEQLRAQQAETSLDASNKTIDALNNAIADKDAEIAALKASAAGKMKETEKEKDDIGGKTEIVSETTAEANRLRAIRDGKK